ncbi:MAG: S8 family serine peptidase [Thermoplasmata archaeon]
MILSATFSSAASSLNEDRWNLVICEERVEEVLSASLIGTLNNNSDGTVEVFINLPSAPSDAISSARRNYGRSTAVEISKNHAETTQEPILEIVEQRGGEIINQFWLTNSIFAEVPVYELESIAQIPQIQGIHENFEFGLLDYEVNEIGLEDGNSDYLHSLVIGSDTPDPDDEWHLDAINARDVWDEGYTGEGVTIAVLDTGVNLDHNEFGGDNDHYWHDVYDEHSDPSDGDGHGTAVSALVAGSNLGVAPDADLYHVNVFDGPYAYLDKIIDGLEFISSNTESDVVVMSLGGVYDDDADSIHDKINDLGIIPVVASGNKPGIEHVNTLAIPQSAIAVGASDENNYIPEFSLGGLINSDYPGACTEHDQDYIKPDFAAPGKDIVLAVVGMTCIYRTAEPHSQPL